MKLHLVRPASLLVLASVALTAQVAQQENVVPLKNWTSPLYWQPNPTERESVATPIQRTLTLGNGGPQLVFSSNQVSGTALTFIAVTPCRLIDTRGASASFNGIAPFSGPAIGPMTTVTFPVQSASEATADTTPAPCGAIPSIAQAYSLNLTVVPVAGGAVDYISMWPSGYSKPFVATLNDPQGAIVSNAAIIPAGTANGGISVYNQGPATANVIIDMNGFFAAPSDLNYNTAIGSGTLTSNTTGQFDTATGVNALQANTSGFANTANGGWALQSNTTGTANTGIGSAALTANTTGDSDTAVGTAALDSNTTGNNNTATGDLAMEFNTTGSNNTASGQAALQSNSTASNNTALGFEALQNNSTATANTAVGSQALELTTTGSYNTASGYQALQANTTGIQNASFGVWAMPVNTTGSFNTANGYLAMDANTTGNGNTAIGAGALYNNTTGGNNIAIGLNAALNVLGSTSANNNIHIGSEGNSTDTDVIWIGTQGTQTVTKIAGIYNQSIESPNFLVCIDATARLGTGNCTGTLSSRRFKDQITDMGDSSNKLFQLRPVTFLYKPQYDDGSHALQYGLVAEEVAKLYPEMVGFDKDGQPNSVKYQALAPMLLNEVQKQNAELLKHNAQLQSQNAALENEVQIREAADRKLEEQDRKLEDRLAALETLLSSQASRPAGSQQ